MQLGRGDLHRSGPSPDNQAMHPVPYDLAPITGGVGAATVAKVKLTDLRPHDVTRSTDKAHLRSHTIRIA